MIIKNLSNMELMDLYTAVGDEIRSRLGVSGPSEHERMIAKAGAKRTAIWEYRNRTGVTIEEATQAFENI